MHDALHGTSVSTGSFCVKQWLKDGGPIVKHGGQYKSEVSQCGYTPQCQVSTFKAEITLGAPLLIAPKYQSAQKVCTKYKYEQPPPHTHTDT